jgi:(p)ppGpp synthase/HD superfamily hydrolase
MREFKPLHLGVIKENIERHASSHDVFMDLTRTMIDNTSVGFRLIEKAAVSLVEDFKGVRRHTGEKYEAHPRAVAIIDMLYCGERDHRIICADLLHDTPEDVPNVTFKDIRCQYGKKTAHLVEGVTKPTLPEQGGMDKHNYDEVCGNIIFGHVLKFGSESIRLKCRDRLHNMLTLWGTSEKKLSKIRETSRLLLPHSIQEDYLWQELTLATAEQVARLHVDDTSK